MNKLLANILDRQPTKSEADFYVSLPAMNRLPVLDSDFPCKLRQYVMSAIRCGFITMDNASFPVHVTPDVIAEVDKALDAIHFVTRAKACTFPNKLFVTFKERRMLQPIPELTVQHMDWLVDGVPDQNHIFAIWYPNGKEVTHELLLQQFATNGLNGKTTVARLLDLAETTNDAERTLAEAYTAAVCHAIEDIGEYDLSSLNQSRARKDLPLLVVFDDEANPNPFPSAN